MLFEPIPPSSPSYTVDYTDQADSHQKQLRHDHLEAQMMRVSPK